MINYYKSGDWNAICDRCGFKFKASALKEDWQGLRVCEKDFEMRHPMDFLRVKPEKIGVSWVRGEVPSDALLPTAVSSAGVLNGAAINAFSLG